MLETLLPSAKYVSLWLNKYCFSITEKYCWQRTSLHGCCVWIIVRTFEYASSCIFICLPKSLRKEVGVHRFYLPLAIKQIKITHVRTAHNFWRRWAHLIISVWHLLMNLKNNYLSKKLLKWANEKCKNFNIHNVACF